MTYGERWRLLVVKWRLAGLRSDMVEARRNRYRIAKREGWAARLLEHYEEGRDP